MKIQQMRFTLIVLLAFMLIHFAQAQEMEAISKPFRVSFKAKDSNAPDVFLVYKNNGAVNENGKVEVEIRIFDQSGVSYVTINNTERIKGQPKDSVKFEEQFSPDEEVSVVAKDNFNNVKEKAFTIKGQIVNKFTGPIIKRKHYALLIGVEEYTDPGITSLNEPIKDAALLKNVLTQKYTFDEQDVTFLKNPTFEDINIAFEELSRKITPEDFLLIFYAGHGFFDESTNIGYWLPADAAEKNKAKWFRNSALVENIGAINSKHTLLIADACFSGGIFKTRAPFNNASIDIAKMIKSPSRKAMTSGSLTTVPDKSVFMKYLLKALNENENQYLPSEDLFDAIRLSMKSNSNTRPLYGEIQNAGDEGGIFVLIRKN